jgi:hypothetical protein
MFSLGAFLIYFGYAMVYMGIANILNGGNGPTAGEVLGIKGGALAPPGADRPSLGQQASGSLRKGLGMS